uniref:Serine protease n=1 Tax=Globodera pallida TaxID=36090 RepID=A0A183CPZ1_GLOPA
MDNPSEDNNPSVPNPSVKDNPSMDNPSEDNNPSVPNPSVKDN